MSRYIGPKLENISDITNDGYLDLLLEDLLDKGKYDVRIKPGFDTACWTFMEKHFIIVGEEILKRVKISALKGNIYYVKSYLYHEVAHSRWTERDLVSVELALKKIGVPFELMNLFEDARIEHLMREESGRPFKWSQHEILEMADSAVSGLFNIIQNDGLDSEIDEGAEWYARVFEYYYKAIIACNSTWALFPLLEEWMDEFKKTPEEIQDMKNGKKQEGDAGNPESDKEEGAASSDNAPAPDDGKDVPKEKSIKELDDLSLSLKMMEDEDSFNEMLKDALTIAASDTDAEDRNREVVADSTRIDEYSNACVRRPEKEGQRWSESRVNRLAPLFKQLFKSQKGWANTSAPGKRLNVPGICRGSWEKPFRKRTEKTKSKKYVNLFLDCSGSMNGNPIIGMIELVDIFGRLAQDRLIEGNVILSGVLNNKAIHEVFRLPVQKETLKTVHACYGAEGLEGAMQSTAPLMKKADWNFVLTDGRLSDKPIDKKALSENNIHTLGIYIGKDRQKDLDRYFDYTIVRPTVEECVDVLLRKLR